MGDRFRSRVPQLGLHHSELLTTLTAVVFIPDHSLFATIMGLFLCKIFNT